MTAPARQRIDFIQSTYDDVAKELLAGKTPAETAEYLGESVPNVMGVWADLRNAGKVEARNFTQQVARPVVQNGGQPSAPPRHETNPVLAQRIADSTDLLVKAASIDDKRIQAALGRARKAMVDLAGLIEHHESKSAARNRIARLEAELRIAKAELRGEPGSATANGGGTGKGGYTRKPEAPVECRKGCGRMCSTAAGRVSHERNCTGAA